MATDPLQAEIQAILNLRANPAELVRLLKSADNDTLYALISRTGYTGPIGAEYEAVRETALAIHEARLAEDLVGTMTRLNESAKILYWVGIAVAIVVGIAEIVVPLLVRH
jgi:hypothetical protein